MLAWAALSFTWVKKSAGGGGTRGVDQTDRIFLLEGRMGGREVSSVRKWKDGGMDETGCGRKGGGRSGIIKYEFSICCCSKYNAKE